MFSLLFAKYNYKNPTTKSVSAEPIRVRRVTVRRCPTDFVPQHSLQPVLTCSGHIDGQRGAAVDHRHGGAGEQVLGEVDHDLRATGKVRRWKHNVKVGGQAPGTPFVSSTRCSQNQEDELRASPLDLPVLSLWDLRAFLDWKTRGLGPVPLCSARPQ